MRHMVFAGFVLGVLFGTGNAIPAEETNRIVAIVNNDVVTLYELNIKIKELTGIDPAKIRQTSEERYLETRRTVLENLIEDRIAQEKVKELNITVSDREVDAAIERIKEQNHLTQEALLAELQARSMSFESYRENVRKDLEKMKLITEEVKSRIVITEDNARRYYEENKEEFQKDATVRLAVIILPHESQGGRRGNPVPDARDLVERIRAGEPLGPLAKQYSIGPAAERGGDLGEFKVKDLYPELARSIEGLQQGEVSEPVRTPAGVQIIQVVTRHDGGLRSFEEEKERIYDILYKEAVNERYSAWIRDLRRNAYTQIIF